MATTRSRRGLRIAQAMDAQRRLDHRADRGAWRQRAERILQHELHRAAEGEEITPDSVAMSTPLQRICPPSGRSRRLSSRIRLDLPQPDSPTMPKILAGVDVEGHVAHGAHFARAGKAAAFAHVIAREAPRTPGAPARHKAGSASASPCRSKIFGSGTRWAV